MASAVDICNLALAHIGDEANVSSISPPDGSVQADHCYRFYPIARDAVLEMHNWKFAVKRVPLALLDETPPAEWAFAYQYPQCLKVLAVYQADTATPASERLIFDQSEFLNKPASAPFTVESLQDGTQVIYTNMEDATAMYIGRVTDTSKFSPLFVVALSRLLASYLAGPIIKGKEGMAVAKGMLEWFLKIEGPQSRAHDAQGGKNNDYDTFIPASLAARR